MLKLDMLKRGSKYNHVFQFFFIQIGLRTPKRTFQHTENLDCDPVYSGPRLSIFPTELKEHDRKILSCEFN